MNPRFGPHTIITTALPANGDMERRARRYTDEFGGVFIERGKTSLRKLIAQHAADRCLVVESEGLCLVADGGAIYRYHPNLGFVRALNLLRGQRDLFVDAAAITPGEQVLDCTAGFGSEALLASLATGESGRVVALESVPELALVTREGMAGRMLSQRAVAAALRRVNVVCADYSQYLATAEPDEYDLISFDPFFAERLEGSEINIGPLFLFGDPRPLNTDAVLRAIAVARRRVIVKHPSHEELPDSLVAVRTGIVGAHGGKLVYSLFDRKRDRD